MKKRTGFTFAEILLALAVLSMVSIMFMSGIATHYSLLTDTKDITEDTFASMGVYGTSGIEEEMKDTRARYREFIQAPLAPGAINPYVDPGADTFVFRLFDGSRLGASTLNSNFTTNMMGNHIIDDGIDVNCRRYMVPTGSGNFLVTLATQYDESELPVPTIDNIQININGGNVGYVGQSVRLDALAPFVVNDPGPGETRSKEYKAWITTRIAADTQRFYLPDYGIQYDDTFPFYYHAVPHWPNDFNEVATVYTDANLSPHTATTAGQHIVSAMYPAAKSGKIGNKVASNAVFVSGLPFTNNLGMHLDASLIQGNYSINYRDARAAMGEPPNGVGSVGNNIINEITYGNVFQNIDRVWNDVRGAGVISATTVADRPELYIYPCNNPSMGGNTVVQYVNFEEDQSLIANVFNGLDSNNFTIFVVARASDLSTNTNPVVLRCDDTDAVAGNFWQLNMSGFDMDNDGSTLQFAVLPPVNNDWNLLSVSASAADVTFSIDGVQVADNGGAPFVFSGFVNSQITIGGNLASEGVDVAEIIIYNNGTLTDAQRIAVNTYLNNKYQLGIADADL